MILGGLCQNIVGHCITTRVRIGKEPTWKKIVFRSFQFGLEKPDGFIEMETKVGNIWGPSLRHFKGYLSIQGFPGSNIVDLAAPFCTPMSKGCWSSENTEAILDHLG